MSVQNGSFELEGAHDGEATGWSVTSETALWRVAGFGPVPLGFEGFDWAQNIAGLLVTAHLQVAVYGDPGSGVETFDAWAGPDPFLFELDPGVTELGLEEPFDWDDFVDDLADVATVSAAFAGPGGAEDFDWPVGYSKTSLGATAQATFGGPGNAESFDGWPLLEDF